MEYRPDDAKSRNEFTAISATSRKSFERCVPLNEVFAVDGYVITWPYEWSDRNNCEKKNLKSAVKDHAFRSIAYVYWLLIIH